MLVPEPSGSRGGRLRRSVVETVRALPSITRMGLSLLLVGFLIDVAAHTSWPEGSLAAVGHVVTLAGMLLALSGVLQLALRRPIGGGHDGRRS